MEFGLGELVWIYPHEELSWCPGEIVQIDKDAYIAIAKDSEDGSLYRIEKINAFPVHLSCLSGAPDLLTLGEFNEGALLHNVRERYQKNNIYTSVGLPILISINPYQKLPIYSESISSKYRSPSYLSESPHLYQMAEKAYKSLHEGNQSIIISGESGSGKTESAKIILNYLANTSTTNLGKQVLDTNPILESFGNAKTLKNDNSSRFGKFIEIHFDPITLKLLSAKIQTYLLEKSRIVLQQEGERNYHFFYQLCAGASEEEREKYSILEAHEFSYLNSGNCLDIEGVDDSENYKLTIQCMRDLGFSVQDIDRVICVVMGVLHLGNVQFQSGDTVGVDNYEQLKLSCRLLGLDMDEFEKTLTTRVILDASNQKEIVISQNVAQAYYSRDAAAKAIYTNLFSWLVEKINQAIHIPQKKASKIIGLLDIYGFEVFDENSFEQFCINYANEKLQQHFNHHMFKLEQAEYSKEKIKWDHISYEDNQVCIDLIEQKPLGIISLLDEQSKLQKGTDKIFLSSLYNKILGNEKLCNPGPYINDFFGISHYAGDVFYNVRGFLDKNRDSLNPQLGKVLERSSNEILAVIFTQPKPVKGKKEGNAPGSLSAVTVGTQFKTQLQGLIKTLSASNPSYIRCIKPNGEKAAFVFDSFEVERQLRCAGMLECIRIRKAGYSVRRLLKEFIDKYKVLHPGLKKEGMNLQGICKEIMSKASTLPEVSALLAKDSKVYQIGISMIFMKDDLRQALDIQYSKAVYKYAVGIQKVFRGRHYYIRFQVLKKSVRIIQRLTRRWLEQKNIKSAEDLIKNFISQTVANSKRHSIFKVKSFIRCGFKKLKLMSLKGMKIQDKVTGIDQSMTEFSQTLRKIPEDSLELSTDSSKPSRLNTRKPVFKRELTAGNSAIMETLNQEVKNLDIYLNREKEKNKSLQEELNFFKNSYQTALLQIQTLQNENRNLILNSGGNAKENKNKGSDQAIQRQLSSKNTEIELLTLKIESLSHQSEEQAEYIENLKKKESKWMKTLEVEMLKHSEETQKLRMQIVNIGPRADSSSEKEIKSLKSTIKSLESESTNLKALMQELSIENQRLLETDADSKNRIKTLQQEINENLNKFNSVDNEKYQSIQKELAYGTQEFQQIIDSQREELEELQENYEKLKSEKDRLSSIEAYYKEELNKSQKTLKDKQNIINDLENQVDELQSQKIILARLKLELEEARKAKSSEEDSELVENLKQHIGELNEEIEEMAQEIDSSKQIYSTLLTIIKFKNAEIDLYKSSDRPAAETQKELSKLKQKEKDLLEL